MGTNIKYTACTSILAIALGFVNPVNADHYTVTFPAGSACSDFDLTVNIDTNDRQVYKEFTDKNGSTVRVITAGKGNDLEFVNGTTGATFSLKANGSVSHTIINPDGTSTVSSEGHNVIILFPTDEPPGPTTTLYVGRITYTVVDATQHFTLQNVSGNSTDICAALSE
jgi:hypothetical protein